MVLFLLMNGVPFTDWKALAAHLPVCLCLWDNGHQILKTNNNKKKPKSQIMMILKKTMTNLWIPLFYFLLSLISVFLFINNISSLEAGDKCYKYWAVWKGILASLLFRTDADDTAISKSEGFFLGSYAMNWSVDIRDENKLLDHQFTFVSKQQLNLFSFSQLTSCSRKKKERESISALPPEE